MSYKRFFLSLALFASFFLTFLLIFSTIWIKKTFGAEVEIAQILFHIQYPIADTDPAFIRGFALKALLPSLLVSLVLVVPLRILASGVRAMWRLGRVGVLGLCAGVRRVFGFGARHSVALRMVACLGFIAFATKLIDTKFQVRWEIL